MSYAMKRKNVRFFLVVIVFLVAASSLLFFVMGKYPIKHIEQINKYSMEYGLDPAFVCAVIHAESKFKSNAKSPKGASGLMQITEPTGKWLADEMGMEQFDYSMIYEPEVNISIGCYYLNRLLKQYDMNVETTLAAYNAGSGNVAKWLHNPDYSADGKQLTYIPFKETRDYIKRVGTNFEIYKRMLDIRSK